jgi:hypothetical protein
MGVVGSISDPFRDPAIAFLIKINIDILPIGFVIIHSLITTAPVIVAIKKPVLENDPSRRRPMNATIIDERGRRILV